ncbi:hypothetical protein ACFL5O_09460, partial [Myxococcota bacterium]
MTISGRANRPDVPLEGLLGHADAELQEFAVDAFGSPRAIGDRHSTNEVDRVRCDAWFARLRGLRFPLPDEPEALPMPADDRLGLHQQDGVSPVPETACENHEDASFPGAEFRALRPARGDDELLAEG